MKAEVSWKRRFLRKRLKYMLVCVFVVAVVFVIHQLFYFRELNRATVGKLIAGSLRDAHRVIVGKRTSKWNEPQHSKLVRDKNGRTVSLRGTRDQDITKYLPNANGRFMCFASKEEIDFLRINDDYCDCPADGSDEPGTNACNNGFFNCETSSRKSIGIMTVSRIILLVCKIVFSMKLIKFQPEYRRTRSTMDSATVAMARMSGHKLRCCTNLMVSCRTF